MGIPALGLRVLSVMTCQMCTLFFVIFFFFLLPVAKLWAIVENLRRVESLIFSFSKPPRWFANAPLSLWGGGAVGCGTDHITGPMFEGYSGEIRLMVCIKWRKGNERNGERVLVFCSTNLRFIIIIHRQ
ncbi:hypothetical protein BY996DRAFT_7742657 [Phakopsora pachyrhizi]|nr:hypothetical protein BY996DRAFT_7742657 [Phakopsora pachyrhizi]